MFDDCFLTVTPCRRTSSGSCGSATASRFCTNTWAWSRLVPMLNVMVSEYPPSAEQVEDMYIMFSTPLTCCSIGAATVSATTWALAPGYWQLTLTVGGAIGGYIAIGSDQRARPPASVIAIDRTVAKIGRSMKKRENTGVTRSLMASCRWLVAGTVRSVPAAQRWMGWGRSPLRRGLNGPSGRGGLRPWRVPPTPW